MCFIVVEGSDGSRWLTVEGVRVGRFESRHNVCRVTLGTGERVMGVGVGEVGRKLERLYGPLLHLLEV